MKPSTRSALLVLLIVSCISCLTINIYFPAEEVRAAANEIARETWGEGDAPPPPSSPSEHDTSMILPNLFAPTMAYAEQNIHVSSPDIDAIKSGMKQRAAVLAPHLNSGAIGIGADGLLKIRSIDALPLPARAEASRLVTEENRDRQRLYSEIAKANGFPNKVGEVQGIFAEAWKKEARKSWWLENAPGKWSQK